MTDLRLKRRIQDGDREALEHIARALEGRALPGADAASPKPEDEADAGETKPAPSTHQLSLPASSLEILLEAMPAAIGILQDGALAYINSAFAYAFGYRSPSELLEAGGLDAILPGGAAPLQTCSTEGRTEEVEALTRSGRRLQVAFVAPKLNADADTRLLRLVDQADLESDPPEVETETTPQAQDAEAGSLVEAQPTAAATDLGLSGSDPAAAARQLEFLAKVSHEVRTPLNSIIGFAELMLHERFGPVGNARYKGYAEDIHQSGLYALSLLNDLLDISKIEAGKFELDFTAVDVTEVVEACVASLQPLAKRTRIVLRTSLADDLPMVLADPRRLRQILLNLLTNAIKFTKEGGQVIVSGTMIGDDLRLRVRDSGVGMSKNDIAYAMLPFHQLDTSPRRQSGTGLGLPLTKALTDAIRARLDLSSEPGLGTSADVIFPTERLVRS